MPSSLRWKHLSRLLFCTGLAVGLRTLAAPLPEGFTVHNSGPAWRAGTELVPDGLGGVAAGITASFPGNTWSEPGQFAAVGIPVTVPETGPVVLSFRLADTFTGPTAGFHFAEVLVGETVLFERDVAGGTTAPETIEIDLRKALPKGGRATLDFRLADRKAVSNFPVSVHFIDPVLKTAQGVFDKKRLLPPVEIEPPEPLAPDLPLPSLPPAGESWTRTARIVQPWGPTQWDAIVRAGERAPWLSGDFGFDAVIVLPPEAHNAITGEEHHVTETEFDAALRAYRAAGFRVVLYTSIMHCGHAPVWQNGSLSKTHPEWSQRGPEGEPVTVYGAEWLCPSTGALPFTVEYTRGLIARYAAEAVMLDNNEFFTTPSGLTCHCAGCQTGFRRYLAARFGDAVLGEPTAGMKIPTEPGALYNVWLRWRNRVWAEATERFRVELRKEAPDVVVLANTQYLRSSPDLATDLQYAHEDA
ncbi:MAG: beta-galactosidase, partial [Planctomycetota bacterium]